MTDPDTSPEGTYSGLCANLRADHAEWDVPLSLAAAETIEALSAENAALRARAEAAEASTSARIWEQVADLLLSMSNEDLLQLAIKRADDARATLTDAPAPRQEKADD